MAWAQTSSVQNVERLFHFTDTPAQALPDVSKVLRTIAGVRASIDADARTITVNAPADQSAVAEWLVHELDQPRGRVPVPAIHEYGGVSPKVLWVPPDETVMKLFYPAHADTPLALIEMITAIRVLADVPLLEPYNEKRIVALAGPADAMVVATWVFHDLDQPPARELTISAYKAPIRVREGEDQVVRVFHLAHVRAKNLGELVASIRNKVGASSVFAIHAPAAIILRGPAAEAAQAENMVKEGDQPGPAAKQLEAR